MVTICWYIVFCNHFFFAILCKFFAKEVGKGRFWLILTLYSDSKTIVNTSPVSLEAAPNVILNLVQDLTEDWISNGAQWDAETSSAWHNKTTTLNEKRPTISSPQTKMSKFAKTKFLLCRVVGVFPSRGSTFFLARQCFGAFTDAPIGGWICKNFYTFFACSFA